MIAKGGHKCMASAKTCVLKNGESCCIAKLALLVLTFFINSVVIF